MHTLELKTKRKWRILCRGGGEYSSFDRLSISFRGKLLKFITCQDSFNYAEANEFLRRGLFVFHLTNTSMSMIQQLFITNN